MDNNVEEQNNIGKEPEAPTEPEKVKLEPEGSLKEVAPVPVLLKEEPATPKKPSLPDVIDVDTADVYKHQLLVERVKSAQLLGTLKRQEWQMAEVAQQDAINKVNAFVDVMAKKYGVTEIEKYKLGEDGKLHLVS